MTTRVSWGSRLGFIFAAAGSAVGLGNIWRFPYVVGENGGAAFILVYILFLFLIGFPVLIAEILIGRTTQTSPSGAFRKLGDSKRWSWAGKVTILTGLIVSSFYSAVAGWILGYLIEAVQGNVSFFADTEAVRLHYESLMQNPFWGMSFHFVFLFLCVSVLYMGVRNGIEKGNKILMPLLFIVLILLVVNGLMMPHAADGIQFLLSPDWSMLTPAAILIALGQSFFTLSIGQGTMVTYGSYLGRDQNLVRSCLPVVAMDTFASLLSAIAVFTIVFSVGMEPDSGPGLIFKTLPWAFSQIHGGYFIAVLFFLLVFLAALTSEISALEPSIAYLMDEWGWSRRKSVICCGAAAFILGVPSALSSSLLSHITWQDSNFLEWISFLASAILIPFGGFAAVVLIAWIWGVDKAIAALKEGAEEDFTRRQWIAMYFWFCFKYSAPLLMILVFLSSFGIFS